MHWLNYVIHTVMLVSELIGEANGFPNVSKNKHDLKYQDRKVLVFAYLVDQLEILLLFRYYVW